MKTVLYNKIKVKSKELCKDYNELRTNYCSEISSLKSNKNIIIIFYLESLLKEKNQIDCAHAVYKGFICEKIDLNINNLNDYEELFINGLDETVHTEELLESSQYCELMNKIRNAEKKIISLFKNNSETIDKLFDIYGNYNFELIRAAYTLGCEYKQFGKIIMDTHI